jgi:hypothetical protein
MGMHVAHAVEEFAALLSQRDADLRVGMADPHYAERGRQIDIEVAIHVLNVRAEGSLPENGPSLADEGDVPALDTMKLPG